MTDFVFDGLISSHTLTFISVAGREASSRVEAWQGLPCMGRGSVEPEGVTGEKRTRDSWAPAWLHPAVQQLAYIVDQSLSVRPATSSQMMTQRLITSYECSA